MKSLIQSAVALTLLTFASASFAQDDVEEEGGWFSGISSFFSNLFSSDDGEEQASSSGGGGIEWYGGGEVGATRHESTALRVARYSYGAYAGGILENRLGFEAGYLNLGDADIKSSPGDVVEVTGFRGLVTLNTPQGDAPVRIGLGAYSLETAIAGVTERSSGVTAGVRLEQAWTDNIFISLGTDLYFGIGSGDVKSDAIMFSVGLSFHTSPPMVVEGGGGEDDFGGVGVTEPAAEDTFDDGAGDEYDWSGGGDDAASEDSGDSMESDESMDDSGDGDAFEPEPAGEDGGGDEADDYTDDVEIDDDGISFE